MKTRKRIFFVICVLLTAFKIQSQGVTTITTIDNGFIVDFMLPSYAINDTNLFECFGINETYSYIKIPYFGKIEDEGYPNLPQHTLNFYLPENATLFNVVVSNKVTQDIILSNLFLPAQDEFITDSIQFVINNGYYTSNGSLYSFDYQISDKYNIMGADGVSFSIFPFRYNPLQNKIVATQSCRFTITHNGSFTSEQGPQNAPSVVNNLQNNYLSQIFDNYPTPPSYAPGTTESTNRGKYLIVTAPEFESTLSYFVNYKRNIGYDVTIVNTNVTGTTASEIKNYLQIQYNNTSTRPNFVLLVGDVNTIPASEGSTSSSDDTDDKKVDYFDNTLTDLQYACLDGNDVFADVFLGRFSVSSPAELQNIIHKTIYTETNNHRIDKNVLLISGEGANHDYKQSREFSNHQDDMKDILQDKGYNCETVYFLDKNNRYNNKTQYDVFDAVNANPFVISYFGHGMYNTINFDITLIGDDNPFNLINNKIRTNFTNTVYPITFGFACLSNCFGYSSGNSFGEAWIRSSHGGVAYYGATTIVQDATTQLINKNIFKQLDESRLSEIINRGIKKYYDKDWITFLSQKRQRHIKSYNLLGDPSLYLYGIGCQSDYNISTDVIFQNGDSIQYRAINSISVGGNNSTVQLLAGSNVTLKAGNVITLLPGFSVQYGAQFNASIDNEDCNSPSLVRQFNSNDDESKIIENINNSITPDFRQVQNVISTFPNPAKDNISFYFNIINQIESLTLHDIKGRSLNIVSLSGYESNTWNMLKVDISTLPEGIYFYSLKHQNGYEKGKFIKKN